MDIDWELVASYTRADALSEGVLVDASEMAAEAGFRVPLALTEAVWNDCVAWPENAPGRWGQSEAGRLWDVCWMAACAARRALRSGNPSPATREKRDQSHATAP